MLAIREWRSGIMTVAGLLALWPALVAQDDEFRVYTDHPRLILTAQRLRLLKRERERESQRWRQFELLVKGPIIEPRLTFARLNEPLDNDEDGHDRQDD